MSSPKEARAAADRLKALAWKVLDGDEKKIIEAGKTGIKLKRIALKNGNITSEIGSFRTPGELYRNSTYDLTRPPIDSPDVAEMISLTEILEASLSIGKS